MTAQGNVGVAFALVLGAGLCTSVGAACAFFTRLASIRFLAGGLGLSAGVMLYVSFVEIFMKKGVTALSTEWGDKAGYRNGTLLFFGGMAITWVLDLLVHWVCSVIADAPVTVDTAQPKATCPALPDSELHTSVEKPTSGAAEAAHATQLKAKPPLDGSSFEVGSSSADDPEVDRSDPSNTTVHLASPPPDIPPEKAILIDDYLAHDDHRFALKKMGLLTALAIGIHNLPEGLATFVAALASPTNGVAIAIAIALHNIPEGVCVAMPVYYATGSRWKGFLWAFISGISEPIGGLLGYFVLYGNRMSDVTYGLLFTVVAGMMTYISIKELIPTALKYDPHDKVVSSCVIAGMLFMAASLLMFTV